jgi:hypothetical protein
VSRAPHYGGGLSEVGPSYSKEQHHDQNPARWYFAVHVTSLGYQLSYSSNTWGLTVPSYNFPQMEGAIPFRDPKSAVVGDIAYAHWTGGKKNDAYPNWSGSNDPPHLSHAAIVTKVSGSNVYVTQQSWARINEPIYKLRSGAQTWQGSNKSLAVYFLNTALER